MGSCAFQCFVFLLRFSGLWRSQGPAPGLHAASPPLQAQRSTSAGLQYCIGRRRASHYPRRGSAPREALQRRRPAAGCSRPARLVCKGAARAPANPAPGPPRQGPAQQPGRGLGEGSHRHKGCLPRQAGDPGAPLPPAIYTRRPCTSSGCNWSTAELRRVGGSMWTIPATHNQRRAGALVLPRRIQGSRSLTSPNPAPALQTADEWSNLPKVTPLEHSIAQTPSQVSPL